MSISATQIQLLRSSLLNNRPDAAQLLDGQPALNTNAAQPGFFFKDNNGGLVKVGPAYVGLQPPNTNGTGFPGNTKGELWFNTNTQELTVWDGVQWRPADPSELGFSVVIIQATAPDKTLYPNGCLWWNDGNGQMYVLYEDPDGRQWIQVGAGGGGAGGAVIISQQQPDPANTSAGALWWNDETGSLFVLYNDGGPEKLWVQIAGAGSIGQSGGGSVTQVQAGTGLTTQSGFPIVTQGTIILKPATATEIGGIKPGPNFTVDPDGTLTYVGAGSGTVTQIQTGPGVTGGPITTTGTIGLASATNTTIGGVKPGVGLGVTGDGTLFNTPATTGQIGGVIVGQGLNVTPGGVISTNPVPPGFIPAGTVQFFAGPLSNIPAGWIYCDGSIFDVTVYPDLFAAIDRVYTPGTVPIGQFSIPDMRGLFPRGWDNRATGGNDNARVLGSYQNDQNLSHSHVFKVNTIGYLGTQFNDQKEALAPATSQMTSQGRRNNGTIDLEYEANTANPVQPTGGAEARPKNIALIPIIKT